MQAKQEFGGEWTEIKLKSLKGYLQAYMLIMANRKYQTVYIDAFAGTGFRVSSDSTSCTSHPLLDDDEKQEPLVFEGSASIALQIEPAFNTYVFLEASQSRADELTKLAERYPNKTIRIHVTDANQYLTEKCTDPNINWKDTYRAVLFLDPFGMSLDWKTLETVQKTKAFDIWYLFPLGAGVNRLLVQDRNKIEVAWSKKLDSTLGTHDWYDAFYSSDSHSLFKDIEGDEPKTVTKKTSFKQLKAFVLRRMNELFGESCVAQNPKILCNTKNSPMYLLCFATCNPYAAEPAIKIAQHLLKD